MTVAALIPPKRIEVNGRPIRFRWVQQAAWGLLVANAGALIISALYYIFVQLRWHVGGYQIMYLKPDWDHLFTWSGWPADRHNVRNVYEGALATLFVKSLLADWRKGGWEAPGWYVALSPLLIVVAAAPFVALGVFLIDHIVPGLHHRNPVHFPAGLDWLGTYLAGFPWQPAVIGVLTGLVVHRVYAPAGRTVQGFFTGRAVDKARDARAAGEEHPERYLPRWPVPPVVRERAAWLWQTGGPVPDRTASITWAVWPVAVLLTALAVYGGYVRYVIAKGH